MDQLFRQDLILGILPGKENALGSTAIRERVARQGLNVDLRTIQRDLNDLKEKYPHVHSRKDGRSTLWWAEKSLSRLSMLPTDAMNLAMIMDHARRFGMAAQVERLASLRDYAVSLLKGNRPSQDVSNKITSNTRFITLQPSVVRQEVLDVIQQALLDGMSIEALYQKRGADKPKLLQLKPLGLSYQDSNIYLSCVFKGLPHGSIAALPLHRFRTARTIFEDIASPEDYDINSVPATRSLVGLRTDHPVQIRLRVSHTLSERLQENPLTDDQTLEPETTGWWLMSSSIHLSQGLDLWLLSQGEHLEVLEPAALRAQIAASAKRMAAHYAGE